MDRYRVTPGSQVDLSQHDPGDLSGFSGDKEEAKELFAAMVDRIAELQHVMWAQDKHSLLVVIQAMDTGGKDSTIRSVFSGVNPQGVRVANFKAPTSKELEHDYLWRIHPHTPGKGEIAVFNRSHYEDVLIVRVLGLAPEEKWSRRYGHINDFERLLTDEGTTVVKLYLHISKEEQAERLQERLDTPHKLWKFNKGDLDHRALWDDYMGAFEVLLEKTSTDNAPWYVIPANRKWYRNYVIGKIIVDTLEGLDMKFPDPEEGLEGVV
ncbi:MAG: polyphosphate kinase 2 family protein, partial [Acidimicrobiia bacterium]|nr:polyphosphate kinase 2 family protein [Acidimicrobiia bacterium]